MAAAWVPAGQDPDPPGVAEVWLPASNQVDVPAVRQFLAALPLPVALEYYGDDQQRALLVRAGPAGLQALAGQLNAAWPRAHLVPLEEDPVAALLAAPETDVWRFRLAGPAFLPLRSWTSFLDGDPVHALLAALLGLAPGEACWFQIHLQRQVQPVWLAEAQRRLKLESQRGFALTGEAPGTDGFVRRVPVAAGFDLAHGCYWAGLYAAAVLLIALYLLGQQLLALVMGLLLVVGAGLAGVWLARRVDPWQAADLALVRQKVACQELFWAVSIQGALRAPTRARAAAIRERWQAALGQYALAGGNQLVGRPAPAPAGVWPGSDPQPAILGPEELAGLWHPPVVGAHIAPGALQLNVVEARAPHAAEVQGVHPIGSYLRPDGQRGRVALSARACRSNIFLIGKPGVGKTTLMERLALAQISDAARPALVVVDPHGDMASRLTGLVAPADIARIRLLDLSDREYALTYNPLDIQRHGGPPERIAQLIVDVGRQLWQEYWGPRMQVPMSRAVQLLAAANTRRDGQDLFGLSLLASLLSGRHELRRGFLAAELPEAEAYQELRRYFLEDFRQLSPAMREQIIQPVLSKALRFREEPLLPLFSCPQGMLDLGQVLSERQILIVNTHLAGLGAELSDFLGSLLLNVLLRQIARQGELQRAARVPVTVIVDEFQTYTGVPWAEWEQQLRKWGGGVILGTQSLASLRAGQGVELPGIITSGTASLFVFAVNGEDAAYLARNELSQLAGGPGPETLANLPPYQAYTRLLLEDGRLSRPFTMLADPPVPFREAVAEAVRARRADYALPYAEALQRARGMLDFLDRFAATSQPASLGTQAPGTQVAQVLLAQAEAPPAGAHRAGPGELLEDEVAFAEEVASELGAFFPPPGADEDPRPAADPGGGQA